MVALAAHRVVVVGGGFGGLAVARGLRREPVEVTLIDRENYHLFQPLLYQVATGALSPANIAVPLRRILSRQRNVRVLLGSVEGFDLVRRMVRLEDGAEIPYDTLVVAAGATHSYFGHDEWGEQAPGLKSLSDATGIRARILRAFEAAEWERDPERRAEWLTFAVVGAGPTGVEMAGAIAELARDALRGDFRAIDPRSARIVLVEGAAQMLPSYPAPLAAKARRALERLGVTVRTGSLVTALDEGWLRLREGDRDEDVRARTVIWAAGVAASPLAAALGAAGGLETDRARRVPVRPGDLTLEGHADVFVIGDMASVAGEDGRPLPGVAPVAIQQGEHVAKRIRARLQGGSVEAFRYRSQGSLATVGRGFAVADFGRWLRIAGFAGWLLWLFVHLLQLAEFENRLLVFTQWAWSYATKNRAARLIVEAREH